MAEPVFLLNMLEKATWHEHKIAKGKKERFAYSVGQDLRRWLILKC